MIKWSALLVGCMCLSHGAQVNAQTGSIAGTIRYVGVIPSSQRITLTDGQILFHNDLVVHKKNQGLRDVAVTMEWTGKVAADAGTPTGDDGDFSFKQWVHLLCPRPAGRRSHFCAGWCADSAGCILLRMAS